MGKHGAPDLCEDAMDYKWSLTINFNNIHFIFIRLWRGIHCYDWFACDPLHIRYGLMINGQYQEIVHNKASIE